jgi:endonuclease-3
MPKAVSLVSKILQQLESHYGRQEPSWPTDPYLFLVWWYSGYPASDIACAKGWEALNREIGVEPRRILAASSKDLATALKPGGMVPELRAVRLKEVAARVQDEFGGDLGAALVGPMPQVRKILKTFHSIADPGADRIILFAGIAPVAAVASNCPHVLVRILYGRDHDNYRITYREAQEAIESEVPAKIDARIRAYLLLKRHGQALCKAAKPKCPECPLTGACAYFAGKRSRA